MNKRDGAALREILRLCGVGANLVARGDEWYLGDPDNVPGLAAESLIIKIGENVARLSEATTGRHPEVPWSLIKRMRDRLAHHYEGSDYGAVWDTMIVDLPAISRQIQSLSAK
ncbi:HepT-like ribonuclease domain-containing protein [Arthrobacter sp. H20]|uniref:HepT-like ribonuclease domain-containing protein n=1 Tax=Arthrobacter sp. H20 TaxID=1267981 RepID=UPI0004787DC8|nr:HepT-like ribonuclease domain-containing protein [Arthrobacter sp. H20]